MVFSVCVKATAVSLRAGLLSSYRLTASSPGLSSSRMVSPS